MRAHTDLKGLLPRRKSRLALLAGLKTGHYTGLAQQAALLQRIAGTVFYRSLGLYGIGEGA